jgi:hypothetical protein
MWLETISFSSDRVHTWSPDIFNIGEVIVKSYGVSRSYFVRVAALVVVSLVGLFALPVLGDESARAQVEQGVASSMGITHGAHIRPTYDYGRELVAFTSLAQKDIGILKYFVPWEPFDPFLLDQVRDQYPRSQDLAFALTWGPGPSGKGCDLDYGSSGPINAILRGKCDAYLRAFARSVNQRPERFLLRLANEMNIADVPWWPGHYGNSPGDFVAMWRRVHDIFRSEGVTNVEWVWSPNYASHPFNDTNYAWNNLHSYYPGDSYVDWIALSGYNWGTPWDTFEVIYGNVLNDLTCRYRKPQILLEVGSVEGPGGTQTKARWIEDMYARLPSYPLVRAVVWFNDYADASRSRPDFRITTSTADCAQRSDCDGVQSLSNWTSAYRTAISDARYTTSLPSLANATPDYVVCGTGPQVSISPSAVLLERGQTGTVTLTGAGLAGPLTFNLASQNTGQLRVTQTTVTLSPSTPTAHFSVGTHSTTPLGTYQLSLVSNQITLSFDVRVVGRVHRVYAPFVRAR